MLLLPYKFHLALNQEVYKHHITYGLPCQVSLDLDSEIRLQNAHFACSLFELLQVCPLALA